MALSCEAEAKNLLSYVTAPPSPYLLFVTKKVEWFVSNQSIPPIGVSLGTLSHGSYDPKGSVPRSTSLDVADWLVTNRYAMERRRRNDLCSEVPRG